MDPKDQDQNAPANPDNAPETSENTEAADGAGANTDGKPSRLARLRKKKDMPGGLWLKCESCAAMIFRKELEEKWRVCPSCSFHFTLPGKERVKHTLDEGTWEEHYADLTTLDRLEFTDKVPYSEKVDRTVKRTGQKEAFLVGTGQIHGRSIVLGILDFAFLGGSMGEVVGEKVALAAELAQSKGLPLLLFTSSGGARMHEGVLSLMQMAKSCAALASLNDSGGFSICVMTHPTTGGVTASFASVCDITLAEPGALIGFAGPRVIATTLKQELPKGFQRAEFLLQKGQIDRIIERSRLREELALLLDYARGPVVEIAHPHPATDRTEEDSETPPEPEAKPKAKASSGAKKAKSEQKKEIKPSPRRPKATKAKGSSQGE